MQSPSTRREFLGTAAAGVVVSLAGGGTLVAAPKVSSGNRPMIGIVFDGGVSQAETFDAKEHPRDTDSVGFSCLHTKTGATFCEVWPQLAKLSGRLCIIRTLRSEGEMHPDNTKRFLTIDGKNFLREHGESHARGGLPYAYISANIPGTGDGLSGVANHVRDFNDRFHDMTDAFAPRWTDDKLVMPCLEKNPDVARRDMFLRSLEAERRCLEGPVVERYMRSRELAVRLLSGKSLRAIEEPPASAMARYGDNQFGRSAYAAGALVKEGIGSVAVRTGHWDFHENMHRLMNVYGRMQDQAIGALIEDIESGELPDTVVFGLGEFGRTPRVNHKRGRDHWSEAHSGFFYGGSFKKGQVYGDTDRGWKPLSPSVALSQVPQMVLRAAGEELEAPKKAKMPAVFADS